MLESDQSEILSDQSASSGKPNSAIFKTGSFKTVSCEKKYLSATQEQTPKKGKNL